jgi:uncharacterized membrane protein
VDDGEREPYERAGTAYLIWPLAVIGMIREDADASNWSRIHTRQALMYGICAIAGALALFTLPLLAVVFLPGVSTGGTVWIYTGGLVLDAVAFVWFLLATLLYASRASRGELFTIPIVSALADRIFRLRR